jgi:hypothetical protein
MQHSPTSPLRDLFHFLQQLFAPQSWQRMPTWHLSNGIRAEHCRSAQCLLYDHWRWNVRGHSSVRNSLRTSSYLTNSRFQLFNLSCSFVPGRSLSGHVLDGLRPKYWRPTTGDLPRRRCLDHHKPLRTKLRYISFSSSRCCWCEFLFSVLDTCSSWDNLQWSMPQRVDSRRT